MPKKETKNEAVEELSKINGRIDLEFQRFLMTCTRDRIENRNYRDLDLESSTTVELHRYYNEVYKKGLHRYDYGVEDRPKRTLSDGHLKLITDAYKTHVLGGERILSRALESHS